MIKPTVIAAVWIASICVSSVSLAETIHGKVVGVSDGDTIRLLVQSAKGPREVKVRLHGIDAPEEHQAFGQRAKQFTADSCFGRPVSAKVIDVDQYGRVVAEVWIEEKSRPKSNLNAAIVENGFAWAYRRYSLSYAEHERRARSAKRGLWVDPNPVPPWEFRRAGTKDAEALSRSSSEHRQVSRASAIRSVSLLNGDSVEKPLFVTRTGTKYHRDGCRYLARSKIPIERAKAQQQYSPCSVCRP